MKGQELYLRAKKRIPGGTQLLSKRPEMFLPDQWPAYYASAKGAEVTDLDGNTYIDLSIFAVGACILGYADPEVDAAVKQVIDNGSMCTLNAPEEVELADLLCQLHPWAEMVRYARAGGESMAIAARIARASSRRDIIAFCGYHGWSDWYLAANLADEAALDGQLLPGLEPRGVPRGLRGTALPFHYNKLDELKQIVADHRGEVGAIIMEPQRSQPPVPGFLEGVRDIANEIGAVLVFDEISSGFRVNAGGIHATLGVNPDMAVFAKAMSNGYPMGAIIGTGKVMQAAQTTFISSTYWTDRIGPAAAVATIKKYVRENVAKHLVDIGNMVAGGWRSAAQQTGLNVTVSDGIPSMASFSLNYPDRRELTTLFIQEMLGKGFLASTGIKTSYAHQPHQIEEYLAAVTDSFGVLADAVKKGDAAKRLKGPVMHQGFTRLA